MPRQVVVKSGAEKEYEDAQRQAERASVTTGQQRLKAEVAQAGSAFPVRRLRAAGDLSRYRIGGFNDDLAWLEDPAAAAEGPVAPAPGRSPGPVKPNKPVTAPISGSPPPIIRRPPPTKPPVTAPSGPVSKPTLVAADQRVRGSGVGSDRTQRPGYRPPVSKPTLVAADKRVRGSGVGDPRDQRPGARKPGVNPAVRKFMAGATKDDTYNAGVRSTSSGLSSPPRQVPGGRVAGGSFDQRPRPTPASQATLGAANTRRTSSGVKPKAAAPTTKAVTTTSGAKKAVVSAPRPAAPAPKPAPRPAPVSSRATTAGNTRNR